MSHLLSLSNSNSKKASDKENNNSKEINKKNNFSGSSSNKVKGEVSSGNGSIESNNANITNSISNNTNSNSNSLSNNNNDRRSKDSITAKRKKYYDKLIRKKLSTNTCKLGGKFINQDYFKNKIEFDSLKNNQSTSSNIKITNNTNIIFNVKSGTKSLDIRALNNNGNKDIMMRDMRGGLNIITQKAICSISTINPLLDTFDNLNEVRKQRNHSNNKIFNRQPMSELLIKDNTDYSINQFLINDLTIDKKYNYLNSNPNININFNNNKPTSSQIINIININGGNYSMDQTKKQIMKNSQRKELSIIKECSFEAKYKQRTSYIPKKSLKNKQYDTETYNSKKGKTKTKKIPNKNSSQTNRHGNTINVERNKNEKNINKYIEHLKKSKKNSSTNNSKKGIFLDINKLKNK